MLIILRLSDKQVDDAVAMSTVKFAIRSVKRSNEIGHGKSRIGGSKDIVVFRIGAMRFLAQSDPTRTPAGTKPEGGTIGALSSALIHEKN